MEVILLKDMEKLGYANDIVNVKPGYANNYLIPQGYAKAATASAKKVLAENLRQRAHKDAKILADAQALEVRCRTVGLLLQFGVSVLVVLSAVVGPEEGVLIGLFSSPCIHHVIAEVEVLRHPHVEVLDKVFLRSEARLCNESFYHCICYMIIAKNFTGLPSRASIPWGSAELK